MCRARCDSIDKQGIKGRGELRDGQKGIGSVSVSRLKSETKQ